MKKLIIKLIALIMTISLLTGLSGCAFFFVDRGDIANLPDSVAQMHSVSIPTKTGNRVKLDKVDLVAEVNRSVVAIMMENGESTSYGSGVIVAMDKEGSESSSVFYILTCHHVISSLGKITVFVPDKEGDNAGESDYNQKFVFTGYIGAKQGNVSLIGGDAKSDVAVLKLDISGTSVSPSDIVEVYMPIDEYKPKVAEDVVAIGNPAGYLPGTVSIGTISYLNRETYVEPVGNMTLMQINVDIYHGSSGGALFNMYGELIGLTNSGSDKYSGLNYAIPFVIDEANGTKDNGFKNIATQLLATATAQNYGYISNRMTQFGFVTGASNQTVTVKSVVDNSKAQKAGLLAGDIILRIATSLEGLDTTADVTGNTAVSSVFGSLKHGDKVFLRVSRVENGQTVQKVIEMQATQYIFCDTQYYPTSQLSSIQPIENGVLF